MKYNTINDIIVKGKKVLVRVDYNVPIIDCQIESDKRIVASLETINLLLKKEAKIILLSHLGRVKEESDKKTKSLKIVAEKLSELIKKEVLFIDETRGKKLETAIDNMNNKDIIMIENTRFEDLNNKAESNNDSELGKYWASLGDVFINDAFGTAHRSHASNVGIASNIKEKACGLLLEKEIKFLGDTISNPKRPLVAILGGSKVSDKIDVINNLLKVADKVILGGGMMFTFLKAEGFNIGNSLCEDDKLDLAKALIKNGKDKLIIPIDTVIAKEFKNETDFKTVDINFIEEGYMGLDIGSKTINLIKDICKDAKSILWNGPMGVFEFENFSEGTKAICDILTSNKNCTTIVGGGDSASAAIQFGYEDKFSHISTGGGASLVYLEGKELPGLTSLYRGN